MKLITITEAARVRFDTTVGNSRKLLHGRLSSRDLAEVQRFAELLARLNETNTAQKPKP